MLELDEGKLSRPVLRRGGESNLASLAGDHGQHGEHRLHQHAILPLPARTEFEVGGVALGGMETQGDRIILTRLPFLSHSVCSTALTKTLHERRRAQVCAPGTDLVYTPAWWGRL